MDYVHKLQEFRAEDLSRDFRQAFDYWDKLRGQRARPTWREVDMMALPLRLVPWCSVVDVISDGEDFVFRFFGTARARMQGRDYTGRSVREFTSDKMVAKAFAELGDVLHRRAPLLHYTEIHPNPEDNRKPAGYEVFRLPFGSGDDIDTILTIVDYSALSRIIYDWFEVEPPIDLMVGGHVN